MRAVVVGLGYVGSVCAACLARDGVEVVGVDVSEAKVEAIQEGRSPVLEPGVDELIRQARALGTLRATTTLDDGVREADIFLVSVGTPSDESGASDLSHLLRAISQLGTILNGQLNFVVNVRSTVLPGTQEYRSTIAREESGRRIGAELPGDEPRIPA
jgi:GDP-mannose 6-dehydrogenase